MIYCFDIDGTICSLKKNSDYEKAEPFSDMVEKINFLYQNGDKIIIMSARGSVSGKDWTEVTANQLCLWGINYHQLIMNKKPHADIFVDDKGMNIVDFTKKHISRKVGFIAGSFDIIHPGYIKLFKEAKKVSIVFLFGLIKNGIDPLNKGLRNENCEKFIPVSSGKGLPSTVINTSALVVVTEPLKSIIFLVTPL